MARNQAAELRKEDVSSETDNMQCSMKTKDDHEGQSGKDLGGGSHIRTSENS